MPRGVKRGGAKVADPVRSRVKTVGEAIEEIENLPERVQDILSSTLNVTVGQQKATRHPFNNRLVQMIGEILNDQQKVLEKGVAEKQAAFDALTPTKGARETALENAKEAEVKARGDLDAAKQAVSENRSKVQEAAAEVETKKKEQVAGDEELNVIVQKKESLEEARNNNLLPLLEGTVSNEEKKEKIDAVATAGRTFSFDASLMQAVVQVLEKSKDERTGFDATCTEQVQAAFASTLHGFDEQLSAGAPAKAERQAAVEQAESAKATADATQTELVNMMGAAKEAKDAAIENAKSAKQSLDKFMPDLKAAGDELDEAKSDLDEFMSGAQAAFNDLKDWKEGDFAPPPVATEPAGSPAGSPAKKARTEGEQPDEEGA